MLVHVSTTTQREIELGPRLFRQYLESCSRTSTNEILAILTCIFLYQWIYEIGLRQSPNKIELRSKTVFLPAAIFFAWVRSHQYRSPDLSIISPAMILAVHPDRHLEGDWEGAFSLSKIEISTGEYVFSPPGFAPRRSWKMSSWFSCGRWA